MAIGSLTAARNWPPAGFDELDDADHRAINNLIADVIEFAITQAAMGTRANQALVINNDGNGYAAADQCAQIKFGNKTVGAFKPEIVTSSSDVILTDNAHGGRVLVLTNTSPVNVTISASSNPASGVSSPFRCEVRNHGTSTVTILFSGITNKNPSTHTKIQANRGAVLTLIGTECWFDGYTSS